jgi:hypothetical protein
LYNRIFTLKIDFSVNRMTRRISLLLLVSLYVCSSLLLVSVRSDEDAVVGEEDEGTGGGGGGGGSEDGEATGTGPGGRPVYKPPARPSGDVYFEESFSDSEAVKAHWIKSKAKKDGADADIAKYDGEWLHDYYY